MDLRSLACVTAIADDLHFRRAAERLHQAPAALSQRIWALEKEIGVALFSCDRQLHSGTVRAPTRRPQHVGKVGASASASP